MLFCEFVDIDRLSRQTDAGELFILTEWLVVLESWVELHSNHTSKFSFRPGGVMDWLYDEDEDDGFDDDYDRPGSVSPRTSTEL